MQGNTKSQWIIVFDLGGTWFRCGLFSNDGQLLSVRRIAAINYKNTPHTSSKLLQQAMVDYIKAEVQRFHENKGQGITHVSISIGACINGHTGVILNAGPLWGNTIKPFDLLSLLRKWEPRLIWTLVNDVTAALLRYATQSMYQQFTRIALMTISTGIAYRTYDTQRGIVPIGRTSGVQGEIGHLPIVFTFRGEAIERTCDCGGVGHMNAYCSGRGIAALLPIIAERHKNDYNTSALSSLSAGVPCQITFEHFVTAVRACDLFACTILDAVTLPLAMAFLHIFTDDAEIERVILTGGIINSLGDYYRLRLLKHLDTVGLYQVSTQDADFFHRNICLGIPDDNAGLIGAALAIPFTEIL